MFFLAINSLVKPSISRVIICIACCRIVYSNRISRVSGARSYVRSVQKRVESELDYSSIIKFESSLKYLKPTGAIHFTPRHASAII